MHIRETLFGQSLKNWGQQPEQRGACWDGVGHLPSEALQKECSDEWGIWLLNGCYCWVLTYIPAQFKIWLKFDQVKNGYRGWEFHSDQQHHWRNGTGKTGAPQNRRSQPERPPGHVCRHGAAPAFQIGLLASLLPHSGGGGCGELLLVGLHSGGKKTPQCHQLFHR